MAWLLLLIAGMFEIVWAIGLKQTDGFSRLWPSLLTLAAMALSFTCLALALKSIPIGNAYAIWTGIGAVGVAIAGMVWFGESADIKRLACIALIVIGIAGLKLLTPETHQA
ncbi:quaternary ammonium compound-resistance protein SugE [Simiduia aestuariiviva]|uniref:Guanidinium exporter n=2 Tax=Simiduia aestuariiviva TaxID=1510459 RepID=A0A839UP31_9GAMM|nr:quaternary ammonium compound-resistance protein SugE [Simiduia aestuariiviva]